MEIRKLENPWSDDLSALVQALPLCWSFHDEMQIKPVDIVRNNDFENPEIGVTHMKDLFLDVTHWRYTSAEDLGRLVHERIEDWYRRPAEKAVVGHWLEASRSTCFPPALAAPYKPENFIHGGYEEIIDKMSKALEPLNQALGNLGGHHRTKTYRFDGSHLNKSNTPKEGGSNGKD